MALRWVRMTSRRMWRSIALLACAGCVAVAAAATAVGRTTASNRQAAIQDATVLLQGVTPPPGALLESSGSGIGPRAQLLTPAFASAVAYRSWSAPDDPASVLSFVEANLPAGSKLFSTGSGPGSQSVIRAWPPVQGVLDGRWLEISVSSRAQGGTLLYAKSQSQWVVERPVDETIPRGVREVDVTSGWPGKAPFLSRRVVDRTKVHRIVALFNSLPRVQPGAINCPAETVTPIVHVEFRAGPTNRLVAEAGVSSAAHFSWPPSVPGWSCFGITFSVLGRDKNPLVGNVITPLQRLLRIKLGAPGRERWSPARS